MSSQKRETMDPVISQLLSSLRCDPDSSIEADINRILRTGVPLDMVDPLLQRVQEFCRDADATRLVLSRLSRFLSALRNPLGFASLVEREPNALQPLLRFFELSDTLSEALIHEPEAYDLLRMSDGLPVTRSQIVDDFLDEIKDFSDPTTVQSLLWQKKHRELLRIAYGDLVCEQELHIVLQQVSSLADAVCEAAWKFALESVSQKRGAPKNRNGHATTAAIIGIGSLGPGELDFHDPLELLILYEDDGRTDGAKPVSNREFYHQVVREFTSLLAGGKNGEAIYKALLDTRTDRNQEDQVGSCDRVLHYYEMHGRTVDRQRFMNARCIAGDFQLGNEFVSQLRPWIFPRYLNRADKTELLALKQRIVSDLNNEIQANDFVGAVKRIEAAVQFLKLNHGAKLKEMQESNISTSIEQLATSGYLKPDEKHTLLESYRNLRQAAHYFKIQNATDQSEYADSEWWINYGNHRSGRKTQNTETTLGELNLYIETSRRILNQVLEEYFPREPLFEPEVNLVFAPTPDQQQIADALQQYGFRDTQEAYQNLIELSAEHIPFLSTRRCRHFFSKIIPGLLKLVSQTPNPDETLVNLERVSESIGGKGVLWELFGFNQPSLELYVRLCAGSPYLSNILVSNPGMIDELFDTLVRDKLPTFESSRQTLSDLWRNVADEEVVLHSFKNSQHLDAGVRDVLGKESIRDTTSFLSDVVELILVQIAETQFERLCQKYGTPTCGETGDEIQGTLIALGKLGGREPNYHSDFDLLMIFDGDGNTYGHPSKKTSNVHFFHELAQQIMKQVNQSGRKGRLFEARIDQELSGDSGHLAISMPDLQNNLLQAEPSLHVQQSLCRARPIWGHDSIRRAFEQLRIETLQQFGFSKKKQKELVALRHSLEQFVSDRNLKRARGGTLDVEFLVQALQLQHGKHHAELFQQNTADALQKLCEAGVLGESDSRFLSESYGFLRHVEARLRLMNTTRRHDLPSDSREMDQLVYLLQMFDQDELQTQCAEKMKGNRRLFESLLN